MPLILPSLASANQACLREEIARLGNSCRHLHFDIEDGCFVPNITFGLKTIRDIRRITDKRFDAHLMTADPMRYLAPLKALGFYSVAVHMEALPYPALVLNTIREHGMRAGLALNPRTRTDELMEYIDQADYALILTCEPDGRGDLFNMGMLKKIRTIRQNAPEDFSILADGDIGEKELPLVCAAGADTVVMGRALFQSDDPAATLNRFLYGEGTKTTAQ